MKDINYEIKKERIRNTIKAENCNIMEVNIEYPAIRSDVNCEGCKKINDFYKKLSDSFITYCERKSKKMQNTEKEHNIMTGAEILKCFVPFHDNEYISFLFEITHFDGYFRNKDRIAQTWRISDARIMPCEHFLSGTGLNPKVARRKVGDMIKKNISSGESEFSYTPRTLKKYAYKVNTGNYFLCKNGIAFWFDKGTIAPEQEGFPTFIIPQKQTELP